MRAGRRGGQPWCSPAVCDCLLFILFLFFLPFLGETGNATADVPGGTQNKILMHPAHAKEKLMTLRSKLQSRKKTDRKRRERGNETKA